MSKFIFLFLFSSSLIGAFNVAEAGRIEAFTASGSEAISSQEDETGQSDSFQSRCRKCRKPKVV